ncbi:MAG: hypothetical protein GY711_29190 [bacterium]|nr:hypothetical protein [bacterium]
MKQLAPALVLLALGCQSPTPDWLSIPAPTTKSGVEVTVEGVRRGTTWLSAVEGSATNVSGEQLTRCRVSFNAYDMHGELLATARAERSGLEAGETWEFRADFPRRIKRAHTLSSPIVAAER